MKLLLAVTLCSFYVVSVSPADSGINLGVVKDVENIYPIDTSLDIGNCYWTALSNVSVVITSLNEPSSSYRDVLSDIERDWVDELRTSYMQREAPAVRKEYRMLTTVERNAFHNAIWAVRNDNFTGEWSGPYDLFATMHQPSVSPASTRISPSQYGWHREYLLRLEEAMRQHDSSVGLPYWDISLDSYLPNPQDSLVWDDRFMGPCGGCPDRQGEIQSGSFAYWPLGDEVNMVLFHSRTYDAMETGAAVYNGTKLTRTCQVDNTNFQFQDVELTTFFEITNTFDEFAAEECFVRDHDKLHTLIGGTTHDNVMAVTQDPITWVMHAYIDFIWEVFRQERQTTELTEYPNYELDEMLGPYFDADSVLHPFDEMLASESLLPSVTENYYIYETAPVTCESDDECFSENLFCMDDISRCQSKLKDGADCSTLYDRACSSGNCDSDTNLCASK